MRQGIICAISTPPGKGGVAIIRMCGDGALSLAESVFSPKHREKISDFPARTQVYGYIMEDGEMLDDGMATYFPAGASYTGEETVEFAIHGGILVTRCVLELLLSLGAIPAEAGEFTKLAFLNGKLDLTEVEAIGNLLEAQSREQIRLSSSSARSRLAGSIREIREELRRLLGSMYARIDYPDEDLGDFTDEESISCLLGIKEKLEKLISTYRTGRAISEGIPAVLVGKPNAGKSTLYNILLGKDDAIVTDIAGTTRDILESVVPLGRVLLRLSDTAGIHAEVTDRVEKIGIDRARERVISSELILALFDTSVPLDTADLEVLEIIKSAPGAKVCVLTKADISSPEFKDSELIGLFDEYVTVSERDEAAAVSTLTEVVEALFVDEKISASHDAVISSARQHSALVRALDFVNSAILAYRSGVTADLASSDIELALGAVGECDGRTVTDEVVGDIFSRFCVGK